MRSLINCALVAFVLFVAADCSTSRAGGAGSGDWQLSVVPYSLNVSPLGADVSPSGEVIVLDLPAGGARRTADSGVFEDDLQVLDFRNDKIVAESPFANVAPGTGSASARDPRRNRFVRFAGNDDTIVAYDGQQQVHIFSRDLKEKSVLQVPLDVGRICAMEPSPNGQSLAVVLCWPGALSRLIVYDLGSRLAPRTIDTRLEAAMTDPINALAWSSDSQELAFAEPEEPDFLVFDAAAGMRERPISCPEGQSSVGIGDGKVYLADGRNLGVVRNKNPKLRVFDPKTGKLVQEIVSSETLPGAGIRAPVVISADGRRMIADTGRERAVWNWGDMYSDARPIEQRLTFWDLQTGQKIATTPDTPGVAHSELRADRAGNTVLVYRARTRTDIHVFVVH